MASTETAPRRKDASRGAVKHLTVDERVARGKAARAKVPRSAHAEFEPAANRADPVWLLERQAESRVPELVPIRYGRMMVSPFAFYRGGALIMAADLARLDGLGDPGAGVRGRPPLQLRRVRLGRAPADLRRQRLRRDAAGAVGVGRQAACGQPGCGGSGEAVRPQAARRGRPRDGRRVPDGDAAVCDDAEPRGVVRAPGRRGRDREGPVAVPGKAGEADRAERRQGTHEGQHARVLQAHARGRR